MASENGWEPSRAGADILEWVKIPGAEHVSLQFMKGWPSAVMRAYAADFHAYIEPLRDADSAAFTPTNSVATSNHLNGTAMDLNWASHEFRVANAGFDPAKIERMRDLLRFYNFKDLQIMFWANDWNNPKDSMHHQMGYDTWNNPVVAEFIRERIRPDGFSTYKRGGIVSGPPVTPSDAVDVLARATGISSEKSRAIVLGVMQGLRASQANNVNRVAMWLAQMGHESGGFIYTEEIASGAAYEGRRDLGNTQPGDGVRFKGRSWIQITGRHNYTNLSKWAAEQGLVPNPTYFVDNPPLLAEIRYAGLGPAWYWTVARPKINEMSDARNLVGVTQAINGGQNGAADRESRYARALSLGDQLLVLVGDASTQGEDDMAQVPQDQWDRVFQELTKRFVSRSPFRPFDAEPADTLAGFTLYTDGNSHWPAVQAAAELGHPASLELLNEIAGGDQDRYPDRADDIKLAQAILHDISVRKSQGQQAQLVQPIDTEPQVVYRDVYTPAPASAPAPAAASNAATSTGQVIGQAYDALEALQLSGALTETEKAPLAALIAVLQTKTNTGETP